MDAPRRAGMKNALQRPIRQNRVGRSCEQPMQIPAGMLALAAVKAVAEDPEAAAPDILDAIIIAGDALLVRWQLPPFRRDAFGAFEAGDLMLVAPRSEERRVGKECR